MVRQRSGCPPPLPPGRLGTILNVIKKTLENRSRTKRRFGSQVAGNLAKTTPKGIQNGANIGLRGQLFGFWANCVFVQHYMVWTYFKGPGGHGTVQKRRQKVLWKRIAEKVTEIPGKYRKVRQKSSPGGPHWSQKVTKNRLKSMPGPPLDPLWAPFWPPGVSGGLRVGARTPK